MMFILEQCTCKIVHTNTSPKHRGICSKQSIVEAPWGEDGGDAPNEEGTVVDNDRVSPWLVGHPPAGYTGNGVGNA